MDSGELDQHLIRSRCSSRIPRLGFMFRCPQWASSVCGRWDPEPLTAYSPARSPVGLLPSRRRPCRPVIAGRRHRSGIRQMPGLENSGRATWGGGLMTRYECPCCAYMTLSIRGMHEICPVCGWEDTGIGDSEPDEYQGGPNHVTLTDARKNFTLFGASELRRISRVRAPAVWELPPDQKK
ncbi:CPCC family cysteine-rich protein [Actinomadura viridis]|uniref:CPCC family cysteine-rich protein n=1 Tax=Actinomadura viridis TaxID=58110 RepID=UPI003B5CAAB5